MGLWVTVLHVIHVINCYPEENHVDPKWALGCSNVVTGKSGRVQLIPSTLHEGEALIKL